MVVIDKKTIKQRSDELSELTLKYDLDEQMVANGVLLLLVMRMATKEDWDEVLTYVKTEVEQKRGKTEKEKTICN